ncbi:rho GTPase-activating protein 32-like [Excalfactoria chinensis]|uniref:rho GTPase-activating protein 32-like n=1 Tax=Excalfactoria chinensis TaxID=46218 RepID=UPI003B3A7957
MRTLQYLMRHLASLAGNSSVTNMGAQNLAIVWAPNLLRSQQSQSASTYGEAACMELQMQSDVVEFLISHTDVLFPSTSTSAVGEEAGHSSLDGPKSVWVSPPSAKLLTLQEAQAERRGQSSSPAATRSSNTEVEEGPTASHLCPLHPPPTQRRRLTSAAPIRHGAQQHLSPSPRHRAQDGGGAQRALAPLRPALPAGAPKMPHVPALLPPS